MRRWLCFAMLATVVALPQYVAAEESEKGKKDGPPCPEMLFKHFDANNDGVIAEDEMAKDAPEPIKALLKDADKNADKKVSLDEFKAAIKDHPLPPRHGHRHFGGPGDPGPQGGRDCPFGGPKFKAPDPKEVFAKLDTDKDGKLSVEEFTEGVKQFEKKMKEMAAHAPWGMMPPCGAPGQGWYGRSFAPGPYGPWPPCGRECPMMKKGPGGPDKDGKALEARVKDLEAKLKAIEAKLDAK